MQIPYRRHGQAHRRQMLALLELVDDVSHQSLADATVGFDVVVLVGREADNVVFLFVNSRAGARTQRPALGVAVADVMHELEGSTSWDEQRTPLQDGAAMPAERHECTASAHFAMCVKFNMFPLKDGIVMSTVKHKVIPSAYFTGARQAREDHQRPHVPSHEPRPQQPPAAREVWPPLCVTAMAESKTSATSPCQLRDLGHLIRLSHNARLAREDEQRQPMAACRRPLHHEASLRHGICELYLRRCWRSNRMA